MLEWVSLDGTQGVQDGGLESEGSSLNELDLNCEMECVFGGIRKSLIEDQKGRDKRES
jgi:hypothetical protein